MNIDYDLCLFFYWREPLTDSKTSQAGPAVTSQTTVLNATEAQKIFPATVFFKGQTASIQGRNSGGLRLADQRLVLIALVDNSLFGARIKCDTRLIFWRRHRLRSTDTD